MSLIWQTACILRAKFEAKIIALHDEIRMIITKNT